MDKDQIFDVIQQNIIDVVPDLANRSLTINDSLRDLGANSVDRAEILIKSMSALKIKAPLVDFAQAKNLDELTMLFLKKLSEKNPS